MSNYSDSSFSEESANTSWYKAFHSIPKESIVLDVGCSSGNFGYELIKRSNCIVDGLEVYKQDAQLAKKKLRNVYQLNIETDNLDVIKEKYDVLYFGDVIEHLLYPVETLKRIKKLLKTNGVVVFSIPNMAYIGVRLDLIDGNFDYTETGLLDKTHLRFFTLEEIERVFNEAGYEISKLDYVIKDYPKKVIEKQLRKNGLTGNSDFYKNASSIEASAFQFVGVSKQTLNKQNMIKRAQFGPVDLFETYLTNTEANYKSRINLLQDENKQLKEDIARFNRNPIKHYAKKIKRKITK